jgi:N-acetylmuramoyl-L-alanine amidase
MLERHEAMDHLQEGWPLTILLALFLAGCAGSPHPVHRPHVEDWESPDLPKGAVPALVYSNEVAAPVVSNAQPATPVPPIGLALTNELPGTWVSLDRWCASNGLEVPERLSTFPQPAWTVRTPSGQVSFRAGSQIIYLNGMEVHLGFAPQWHEHQPFIHSLDLRKSVVPLLSAGAARAGNAGPRQVIVIDPGHGGVDTGARSVAGGGFEKDLTLDWARRLETALAGSGCTVFLTRRDDRELSLPERVAFATSRHADVFISLHFNSVATDQHTSGLETYCLTPAGMPSTETRNFSDDPWQTFPNNRYDTQNIQLAVRVHHALLQVNGHLDRGVRRARFPGVLRGQQQPSILVEGGYLTNPQEAHRLADPVYRQQLAEALARALTEGQAIN